MDLRQLRYFTAIVDCGSLSKAATRLHVAQPALSQHVRNLEGELRVHLLDRTSLGVRPTDAGRRLYQHSKSILAQMAQVPDLVREAVMNPVGEVRFGMSGTVCELIGIPLIEAARDRYPGIRIRPVEAMSGYVLEWLRRGEVDVALVYATADPSGLIAHHALTEELCLLGPKGARVGSVSPGSAVTLSAALKLDLITPGMPHALRALIERAASKIGEAVAPTLEIDSYRQIKQLVVRGAGFGILPETAVQEELRRDELVVWPIGRPRLRRRVYLAYMKERPLSAAARAASRLGLEIARELVEAGTWIARLAPDSGNVPWLNEHSDVER